MIKMNAYKLTIQHFSKLLRIHPPNNVHDFHAFKNVRCNCVRTIFREDVDYVTDDIVMILSRTLVGSIIIARIGLRKIGHRIVFDVAVFDFIHVLTADLDAAVFSNDGQAAFLVLIPH